MITRYKKSPSGIGINSMNTFPLSLSQKDIWLEYLSLPNSSHLNIGVSIKVDGIVDSSRLLDAIKYLFAQNDGLRCVIENVEQQTCLAGYSAKLLPVEVAKDASDNEIKTWIYNWISQAFSGDPTPPVQFALTHNNSGQSFIVLKALHSSLDGWSVADTIRKLVAIYNQLSQGQTVSELEFPSYLQYVEDSLTYKNSKQFIKDVLTSKQLKVNLPAQCVDPDFIPFQKLVDKLNKVLTVNQVDTVTIPNAAISSRYILEIMTLLTELKVKITFEKQLNKAEASKIPLSILRRIEN